MITAHLIEVLARLVEDTKPQSTRIRAVLAYEVVKALSVSGDTKLLHDWQVIQGDSTGDGWIDVETKYLDWARASLQRTAGVFGLLLLLACPLWAQTYPNEQTPLVDPIRAAEAQFGASVALDVLSDTPHQPVVDVLFAFSDKVWAEQGGTDAKLTAWAQQVVNQWNQTIVNNHVAGQPDFLPIRVCAVLHTTFIENHVYSTYVNGTSALTWMGSPAMSGTTVIGGGQAEILAAKTAHGCDVVEMESHTDSCGLSYECPTGALTLASVDISCAISNLSAVHELGHTFCGNHEPESDCGQATCGTTPSSYGTYAHGNGWGNGTERDPLTYPRQGGSRVLYWSSPLTTRTVAGIVYPTGTVNQKDNARAFREHMQDYADMAVPVNAPPAPAVPGIPSFSQ